MSSTTDADYLEDADAASRWAMLHGLEHWILVSPKGEWLAFCRRSDGVVFAVGRFTDRQHVLTPLLTLPREKFNPVRDYVILWRRFREAGWTETRGSNDA